MTINPSAISRFRHFRLTWIFVVLLALLCGALAYLQNHWIYEISLAEKSRLEAALQTDLARIARDFEERMAQSYIGLTPSFGAVSTLGSKLAVTRQYERWKQASEPVFKRVAVVTIDSGSPMLSMLDPQTGALAASDWPKEWKATRLRAEAKLGNQPLPPLPPEESGVLDLGLFGSMHQQEPGGRPGPPNQPLEDSLLLEIDMDYVRSTLLPELVTKYLPATEGGGYDFELVTGDNPGAADAAVPILDTNRFGPQRNVPRDREQRATMTRWQLLVRHHGTSLEDIVSQARWRNIAMSAGLLLLIVAIVLILLRLSRQSEQLASLQVNFVASVSHELRTPLTVIRTLAFNLRGSVSKRPEQVEKYGKLIQGESEKLSILVDQVLRYGSIAGGKVIGERRTVPARTFLESTVESSPVRLSHDDIVLDVEIPARLPQVFIDELALRHVVHNLIDNAVKYGLEESNWIGLSAAEVTIDGSPHVEIRVSDRGPGIPVTEQSRIFDAFFRGTSAVHDQVHGTGLGLNLAKRIVEAHGGAIRVESVPRNTQFIVTIPVAPEELVDVFSNTAG